MKNKTVMKISLLAAFVLISLGGWMLHYRIHKLAQNNANYVPFICGVVSTLVITALFHYRKTVPLAYLINGIFVIIGTVTMGHYSLIHLKGNYAPSALLFTTLFCDILTLWARFFIGKSLFELEFFKMENDAPKGSFFRYPNPGFWLVHLVTISVIYGIGSLLGRLL